MVVNSALLNYGSVALAPLLCWLWHAAHEDRWPWLGGQRGTTVAGITAIYLLVLQSLAIGLAAHSVALGLTLPLASIAFAGSVYVPCVRTWPGPTVLAALLSGAAGCVLLGLAVAAQ